MAESYRVNGMTCGGCATSVRNAILDLAPKATVEVDLDAKTVSVNGADPSLVEQAIRDAGFEYLGKA